MTRSIELYNQLAAELKYIEDQIREIKHKQFTGTDTIQTYQNQLPGAWDIDWNASSSQIRDFNILFEANEQDAPANFLSYLILINNATIYTGGSFMNPDNGVAVSGYVHDSFLNYASVLPQPKLDSWYFAVSAYATVNIKVKFTVHSTDLGALTMTEL